MAEATPPDQAPAGVATLMPPLEAEENKAAGVDRLTPSESLDSRVETWHHRVAEGGEEMHEEMVRAREILHTGTSADAVELANEDIEQRAIAAAGRWRSR